MTDRILDAYREVIVIRRRDKERLGVAEQTLAESAARVQSRRFWRRFAALWREGGGRTWPGRVLTPLLVHC